MCRPCRYDPASRQYRASVLYIVHQARSPQPPTLKFRDVDVPRSETPVQPTHLDHYQVRLECGMGGAVATHA